MLQCLGTVRHFVDVALGPQAHDGVVDGGYANPPASYLSCNFCRRASDYSAATSTGSKYLTSTIRQLSMIRGYTSKMDDGVILPNC